MCVTTCWYSFSACHYLHNASFIEKKKNKSKNLIFPLKLKQDLTYCSNIPPESVLEILRNLGNHHGEYPVPAETSKNDSPDRKRSQNL